MLSYLGRLLDDISTALLNPLILSNWFLYVHRDWEGHWSQGEHEAKDEAVGKLVECIVIDIKN